MNNTPMNNFCDGVNRRNFLRIGALAPFGVTLPGIFQAEAASNIKGNQRSVIMIYLSGGMAHQDSFDLKPNAPT